MRHRETYKHPGGIVLIEEREHSCRTVNVWAIL